MRRDRREPKPRRTKLRTTVRTTEKTSELPSENWKPAADPTNHATTMTSATIANEVPMPLIVLKPLHAPCRCGAGRISRAFKTAYQARLKAKALQGRKIFSPGVTLIQDVKFLVLQPNTTQTIGAVRAVGAKDQVRRPVAAFTICDMRAAMARAAAQRM